jgi:hypothetical protein
MKYLLSLLAFEVFFGELGYIQVRKDLSELHDDFVITRTQPGD